MPAQLEEILEDANVTLADGSTCKLSLRPATMFAAHQAYRKACLAFYQETKERGCSPEVFTEEWAKHRIRSWPFKIHVSAGGWRLLSLKDGPILSRAIGADEAMASIVGDEKLEADAKNSQPESSLPTSTPASSSTSNAGAPSS